MPNITGFEQDGDFPDDPDYVTGKFYYDDGTSAFGQLPSDEAKQYKNMSSVPAPDVSPTAVPGQAPPPINDAARPPSPMSEAPPKEERVSSEAQQTPKPEAPAEPEGIDIPKASRIAWIHNNPGNLKYAGQNGAEKGEPASDGGYWAHFESPEDGYRALAHQVDRDAEKGGTLAQFVSKYAPPQSNDTAGYIAAAARQLGVSADTPMTQIDRGKLTAFMAMHESGTRAPGGALVASSPSTEGPAKQGQLPASMGGMMPAEAEQHGQMLSPQEMQQRQQAIVDRTLRDTTTVQAAAQARIEGRQEMQAAQVQQYQADQQNALGEQVRQEKIRVEAEQNIQREVMQPIQKVDPNRYLRTMSTGDRILGAVGIMIAGLGLRPGQQNPGIELMQDAINKDIDAQKEDIANNRMASQNRVAFWSHKLGSSESGIAAAKLEARQAAANLLQAKAVNVENADIKAQMMTASQQLIDSGQQEAQQLGDQERNRVAIKYAVPKPTKTTPDQVYRTALDMTKAGASKEQVASYFTANGMEPPAGEGAKKFNRDQARLLAVNEDAVAKLQQFAKLRGFFYDPKTDSFIGDGSTRMILDDSMSDQNANVTELAKSIAPVISLAQGGGLKGHENETRTIIESMTAHSPTIARAALNQHWQAIRNVMRGVHNYPSGAEQEAPEDSAPQ